MRDLTFRPVSSQAISMPPRQNSDLHVLSDRCYSRPLQAQTVSAGSSRLWLQVMSTDLLDGAFWGRPRPSSDMGVAPSRCQRRRLTPSGYQASPLRYSLLGLRLVMRRREFLGALGVATASPFVTIRCFVRGPVMNDIPDSSPGVATRVNANQRRVFGCRSPRCSPSLG